jgi:hypothetical protein
MRMRRPPRVLRSIVVPAMCAGWLLGAAGAVAQEAAGRTVTGLAPDVEARIDAWFHEAMDFIYRSEPSAAARLADEMRAAAPGDPRAYLLQARILRLDVPDQNFEREDIKPDVVVIDSLLALAVQGAERMLAKDPKSVPGLLYRGWARMFESQMRALASEYWGAGRKAKSGKRDLDALIEIDPDNPDARFVLGTYDYFADILPGLVKVAGFLVRVPGGDLERGIAGVRYAAQQNGYSRLDARAILGVIYFGFEGRFDDARRTFDLVDKDYPNNARILEPLAVMDLFQPEHALSGRTRTTFGVQHGVASPEPGIRNVAERLRLYQAMAELLTGDLEAARTSLEVLYANLPRQPDWLGSATRLALADLSLLLGDAARAARLHADVAGDERAARRLRYAVDAGGASTPNEAARMLALRPAIQALYAHDLGAFNRAFPPAGDGLDPYLEFYRGEFELLRGTPQRALAHYEHLTREPLAPRWRLFRFFAFLRIAEIHGKRSHNEQAVQALEKALAFHTDPDLLRHVAKARKRFYESGQPQAAGSNGGLTRRSAAGG